MMFILLFIQVANPSDLIHLKRSVEKKNDSFRPDVDEAALREILNARVNFN